MHQQTSNGNGNGKWSQYASLTIQIIFPFLTMVVGWTANTVVQNMTDIAQMKANRYTIHDAHQERKEISAQIEDLKDVLSALDKKVPDEIPPEWFKVEVNDLKSDLQRLHDKVVHITNQVNGHNHNE